MTSNARLLELLKVQQRKQLFLFFSLISVLLLTGCVGATPEATSAEDIVVAPLAIGQGTTLCEQALNTPWPKIGLETINTAGNKKSREQNAAVMEQIVKQYQESPEVDPAQLKLIQEISAKFNDLLDVSTSTDAMSLLATTDGLFRKLGTLCKKSGFTELQTPTMVGGVQAQVDMAIPSPTPVSNTQQGNGPGSFRVFEGSPVSATIWKVSKCGKKEHLCIDVAVSSTLPCPGGIFVDVLFNGIKSNAPVDAKSITTKKSSKGEDFKLHFESKSPYAGKAEVVDVQCIGGE